MVRGSRPTMEEGPTFAMCFMLRSRPIDLEAHTRDAKSAKKELFQTLLLLLFFSTVGLDKILIELPK